MIKKKLKEIYKRLGFTSKHEIDTKEHFISNGMIPWSRGYKEYKTFKINESISDTNFLKELKKGDLPTGYGYRIDERIVEYPWIFSNLSHEQQQLLDAGSTFNFDFVVNHPKIKNKKLTIFTYAPEDNCFFNKGISYIYGDLRALPFRDNYFDTIVSQSTIEHIDMDNSIYGYDINHHNDDTKKSYSYLVAVQEMLRTLKNKGELLITFPYGKFEHHGFFQQFDEEMLNKLLTLFDGIGTYDCRFFLYKEDGWIIANQNDLKNSVSYNPHTGKGKLDDNAAHCRSVACLKFIKN
ncbi:class I SAM-dependent methyltransferase [uncultured Psychroserpens sp.]|uniref:class I SAM-dependent methyltransferase n=1 Tax=uncultured Psychroserpens sp. TaxID=255436 RepID=UPI00261D90D7|nr:methyltransferase domain-containing protein [uncultured Psychroserpens sp.]